MRLDADAGGFSLTVGYTLLLAALFRDPASGLDAVSGSLQGLLFFGVLPLVGLASGGYVYWGLPFGTGVAFVTGTYLAIAGLALALLPTTIPVVTTLVGLTLLTLGVVALVGTVRSSISALFPELSLGDAEGQ